MQLLSAATARGQLRPGKKLKLDCRVQGNPSPWVQWYRNGKLLRNKRGRLQMGWTRARRGRVNRLQIELRSGRNESGIYECRAMNVAAREPAVGAYSFLQLPEQQFVLIPVAGQQAATTSNQEQGPPSASGGGGQTVAGAPPEQANGPAGGQEAGAKGGPSAAGQVQQGDWVGVDARPAQATGGRAEGGPSGPKPRAGDAPANPQTGEHAPSSTRRPRTEQDTPPAGSELREAGGAAGEQRQESHAGGNSGGRPPAAKQADKDRDRDKGGPTNQAEASAASKVGPEPERAAAVGQTQGTAPREPGGGGSNGAGAGGSSAAANSSPVVVGQPCPSEANENFCLNKGTCVLIGHIEEYFCK